MRFATASSLADRAINEIAESWLALESNGFPPEAIGWPEKNIGGQLPNAINSALLCLIRQREDLLARGLAAEASLEEAIRGHRALAEYSDGDLAHEVQRRGLLGSSR